MLTTEYYNITTIEPDLLVRQPRTFQGPLLGLLLAATFLAKASQGKPHLLGYGNQQPWVPYRPIYPYIPPVWYSLQGNFLQTTHSPQIQPPPLHQHQIIHIHDRSTTTISPQDNSLDENPTQKHEGEENISNPLEENQNPSTETYEVENQSSKEVEDVVDNEAEPSNQILSYVKYDNSTTNTTEIIKVNKTGDFGGFPQESATLNTELEFPDYKEPENRPRRGSSRKGGRRPDYLDRVRNKKRPARRRSTTPIYGDYFDRQVNRRRRRPGNRNRNKGHRRPVHREPDYYGSYGDYYDDYFARQDDDDDEDDEDTSSTSTTTESTGPTGQSTGYTYGPPVYGPPSTGYGPPNNGYGPPNGNNDHISITYAPPSAPGRDVLSPLLDAWYSQYSKSSVLRRLQELLQPNNFYNNQQYDVNYQDSF